MTNLSFSIILIIFLIASAATWIAGVTLAKATDTLDTRFKIGDALGGLVLLGIAGSLPEIAVVYSAARDGHIPVIIGNLIGGISIQTLIIVIFDLASRGKRPLSYLAGTIVLSFETIFAMVIAAITIIGIFIPKTLTIHHLNPMSILLLPVWIIGLFLINHARKNPAYNKVANQADPGRGHHQRRKKENHPFFADKSTWHVGLVFLIASVITLIAGVFLEKSGSQLADKLGIGSGLFAATIMALVTALPEISTGLESILIGDNQLAISDIMGGNAFMLVIFLIADLVALKPVLSYSGHGDIIMAILGILMMAVYAVSYIRRPQKRYFRMGIDSIFVILLYIAGLLAFSYIK